MKNIVADYTGKLHMCCCMSVYCNMDCFHMHCATEL